PVRRPIDSNDAAKNAVDDGGVRKAAAVFAMFESWLGPEKFREAVRRYVKARPYRNATSGDFFASLSEQAGRDVEPALSSFLDQPGVPLVSVAMHCKTGAAPIVVLSQQRFAIDHSAAATPADPPVWQIPI